MDSDRITDIDQLLNLLLVFLIMRKEHAGSARAHKDEGIRRNDIAGKFGAIAICVVVVDECHRISIIPEMNHSGGLICRAVGFPDELGHII